MAVGEVHLESDGKAVDVTLTSTVGKDRVAVVESWVGITLASGDSGDGIALAVDDREYQLEVPAGLAVNKGDIIYVEVADVTGHYPDDTAYSTTAGAGKVAFMKASMDKNADNVVTGHLLAHNALAS